MMSSTKYLRIKQISKLFRIKPNTLIRDLVIKHRSKFFCHFDNVFFEFPSIKDIIIPESYVLEYVNKSNSKKEIIDKSLLAQSPSASVPSSQRSSNIESISSTTYHNCSDNNPVISIECLPVVAILGHFDHGKTTLLDRLGGTNLGSGEVQGITQSVRTQCINLALDGSNKIAPSSSSANHDTNNDLISLSEKWITCVDTPGQDFFYRMRNYGASVADVAVLVIAIDSGICSQTQESIGIAEGLGIPVIVVINKIDLLSSSEEELQLRLTELRAEIAEYAALSHSPVVAVSAKVGTNLDELRQTIYRVASKKLSDTPSSSSSSTNSKNNIKQLQQDSCRYWASFGCLKSYLEMPLLQKLQSYHHRQRQQKLSSTTRVDSSSSSSSFLSMSSIDISDKINNNNNNTTTAITTGDNDASTGVKCSAVGTVLNLWRNAKDGTSLHIMVTAGCVSVGDSFVSGGWSGMIKRIYLSSPVTSVSSGDNNNNDNNNNDDASNGSGGGSKKLASAAQRQPSNSHQSRTQHSLSLIHAGPGVGVQIVVEMHDTCDDPRPLGESITFCTHESLLPPPSLVMTEDSSSSHNNSKASKSKAHSSTLNVHQKKKVTECINEYVNEVADSARMEYTYYNHALSDTTALSYRLPDILRARRHTGRQLDLTDPTGGACATNIDGDKEEEEEEDDNDDMSKVVASGDNDKTNAVDDWLSSSTRKKKTGKNGSNADIGFEDESGVINVILKADSDIILGTITDSLEDAALASEELATVAGDGGNSDDERGDIQSGKSRSNSTNADEEIDNESKSTNNKNKNNNNIIKNKISTTLRLKLVQSGVGEVLSRDVLIANAAQGYIFAYNVPVQSETVQKQAARQGVKIIHFHLIQDILKLFAVGVGGVSGASTNNSDNRIAKDRSSHTNNSTNTSTNTNNATVNTKSIDNKVSNSSGKYSKLSHSVTNTIENTTGELKITRAFLTQLSNKSATVLKQNKKS